MLTKGGKQNLLFYRNSKIQNYVSLYLKTNQYRREAKEIFELQQEIAKNITEEVQIIITPEEEKRIDKKMSKYHENSDKVANYGDVENSKPWEITKSKLAIAREKERNQKELAIHLVQ